MTDDGFGWGSINHRFSHFAESNDDELLGHLIPCAFVEDISPPPALEFTTFPGRRRDLADE